MTRRLAQLAEESRPFKDDPLAGKPWFPDTDTVTPATSTTTGGKQTDSAKLISEMVQKLGSSGSQSAATSIVYQRETALATLIPDYAPPGTRDLAMATPWTGAETAASAATRLKNPPKSGAAAGVETPKSFSQRKQKQSVSKRLADARDGALDYQIQKHSSPSAVEEKEERPSILLEHSALATDFTALGSLASQRIEAAMSRGEFQALPGRGQPQPQDHRLASPYIEHTEYYLNNMIKRQGAAPIWIDRQGALATQMEAWRGGLTRAWVKYTVHELMSKHGSRGDDSVVAAARAIEGLTGKAAAALPWNAGWAAQNLEYHTHGLDSLNSSIRSYNLQAPSAARRGYLLLGDELQRCYEAGCCEIVREVDVFLNRRGQANELEGRLARAPTALAPSKQVGWGELLKEGSGGEVGGYTGYVIEEKGVLKGLFKSLWTREGL